MRKMIVVAVVALSLTAVSAGYARQCNELPDEAVRTYSRLRAAREAEFAKIRTAAEALKTFQPEFTRAVDEFNTAHRAVKAKEGQRPSGNSSTDERAARTAWDSELSALKSTRYTKMSAVNAGFVRLGRDNRYWLTNGQVMGCARDCISEALDKLDNGGAANTAYIAAINSLIDPPDGLDNFARDNFTAPSLETGMIQAFYTQNRTFQTARDAELEHTRTCQAGYQLYNDNVLAGRNGDGTAIVAGQGNGQAGTTGNVSTSVNNPGIITGETNNVTGTTNVTTTANTSTTATGNVTTTANTTNTALQNYVVRAGDNLTSIARGLAAQMGNKPVQEIVNALYRNMTTRSRSNPNLIFPGDTINLAGVRRDLRVG